MLAQQGVVAGRRVVPGRALLGGLRQPIVAVLLLIAFCTAISGRVLDGGLMLAVAVLLAVDAGRSRLGPGAERARARAAAAPVAGVPVAPQARRGLRKKLTTLALVAFWVLYAIVAGSFRRYTWPATACVLILGCLMVATGWQGPLRQRAALTGLPLRRAWLWAVVVVAGGVWELSSLLQQPTLTTDSYAHPTISALTDPVLGSHAGRSLIIGVWLLIGWFLAGR